jgi:hypothetical protein
MSKSTEPKKTYVTGPNGSPLTLADLPPPDTKRWVAYRKAIVVSAVQGGLLSLGEACRRYSLTVEEYVSWKNAIERFGLDGLRVTRMQDLKTGAKREEQPASPSRTRLDDGAPRNFERKADGYSQSSFESMEISFHR